MNRNDQRDRQGQSFFAFILTFVLVVNHLAKGVFIGKAKLGRSYQTLLTDHTKGNMMQICFAVLISTKQEIEMPQHAS